MPAASLGLEEKDAPVGGDGGDVGSDVLFPEAGDTPDPLVDGGDAQSSFCTERADAGICEDFERGSPVSRGWSVVADEWQDAWVPLNDGGLSLDRQKLAVFLPLDSLRLRRRGVLRPANAVAPGRLEFDAVVLNATGSVTLAQVSWGIGDVVTVEAFRGLGTQMTVTLRFVSFGRAADSRTLSTLMKIGTTYRYRLFVGEKAGAALFNLEVVEGKASVGSAALEYPGWRFDGGGTSNEYFLGIRELDRANDRGGSVEIDNVTLL